MQVYRAPVPAAVREALCEILEALRTGGDAPPELSRTVPGEGRTLLPRPGGAGRCDPSVR